MYLNKTGRHWNVGQENPMAKLTESQVDEIKELCGYMTDKELSRAYSLSHQHVWNIRKEKVWRHL